jgi:hypothetical protein
VPPGLSLSICWRIRGGRFRVRRRGSAPRRRPRGSLSLPGRGGAAHGVRLARPGPCDHRADHDGSGSLMWPTNGPQAVPVPRKAASDAGFRVIVTGSAGGACDRGRPRRHEDPGGVVARDWSVVRRHERPTPQDSQDRVVAEVAPHSSPRSRRLPRRRGGGHRLSPFPKFVGMSAQLARPARDACDLQT